MTPAMSFRRRTGSAKRERAQPATKAALRVTVLHETRRRCLCYLPLRCSLCVWCCEQAAWKYGFNMLFMDLYHKNKGASRLCVTGCAPAAHRRACSAANVCHVNKVGVVSNRIVVWSRRW